jgi:U3 small nucleolar ribonucleoprotein component
MRDLISHYEQENLQPRSWEFSGEIEAHQREKDGLLQHYIEVDYRATQAPIISDDVNSRIESIVKQRIKDKVEYNF